MAVVFKVSRVTAGWLVACVVENDKAEWQVTGGDGDADGKARKSESTAGMYVCPLDNG